MCDDEVEALPVMGLRGEPVIADKKRYTSAWMQICWRERWLYEDRRIDDEIFSG